MTIPFKHRRVLGYLDLLPLPKFLLEPLCGTEPKHSGVTKGGMWCTRGEGAYEDNLTVSGTLTHTVARVQAQVSI